MTTDPVWISASLVIGALAALTLWAWGRASPPTSPQLRKLLAVLRRAGTCARCAGLLVELAAERLAVDVVASAGSALVRTTRTRRLRAATWALSALAALAIVLAFVSRIDWS